MRQGYGPAGRLASAFVDAKVTPLLMIATLLLGALAVLETPREEEPQIVVPFADVMVGLPGASPSEVEDRVARPLERLLLELPGIRYVYATSLPDLAVLTVRFQVGDDQERSLVRLYDALAGSMDAMPEGASPPLVKARLIDDVPILALTLWQEDGDERLLRQLTAALEQEVRAVDDVSVTSITGGRRAVLDVRLDPEALAAAGVTALDVSARLQAVNVSRPGGDVAASGRTLRVRTRGFLTSALDVANVIVGVVDGRPVRLGSVAEIAETADAEEYVRFVAGSAIASEHAHVAPGRSAPAVTLSVAKRKGTDATTVAEAVLSRIEHVRDQILPSDVELTVARNYGETANEKASDLLKHLFVAIASVTIVIAFALGIRGAAVIFISVPITFALTLFVYYLFGYTLNRVTLFALIFVTGIVVDDSIIVVENIYRHMRMHPRARPRAQLLGAVSEVGNPTVLATLTVIASVFPMAYVGGLMGPYMRPMPIGASLAMTFSLFVALTIAPWLSNRLLVSRRASATGGDGDAHGEDEEGESAPPRLRRAYARVLGPLLARPRRGVLAISGIAALLLVALALIPLKLVTVKMLPFDNKSEIQLLVDMPEGTPLETTARVAREVADAVAAVPEVTDIQLYAGTAAPITFNGLIRHYDHRRAPHLADVQVNLRDKKDRSRKSHELASVLRGHALPVVERHGGVLKVVEVPPGPPVLATLVAEIYGPDDASRLALAEEVKAIMAETPGVVDVDWMVEAPEERWDLVVDHDRAALAGVAPAHLAESVNLVLGGREAGVLHPGDTFEPVPVRVRWGSTERTRPSALADLRVRGTDGGLVPAAALTNTVRTTRDRSLHRKNARPLVYVTADVAGEQESPGYAMLDMKARIAELTGSNGEPVEQLFSGYPESASQYAVRWDGEWEITREVFRDLGLAFGVVLILIYMLIAAWFQDLRKPLVMMVAVPLSLVGVIPGHLVFGGFFTATSMIGFIALAGIMVRNGVLLLDFVALARARGLGLEDALLEAGAVRLRPIVLTAGTVVVGAVVILFDPIFQGLAISLISGSIASTALTLVVVPIVYYLMERNRETLAGAEEVS